MIKIHSLCIIEWIICLTFEKKNGQAALLFWLGNVSIQYQNRDSLANHFLRWLHGWAGLWMWVRKRSPGGPPCPWCSWQGARSSEWHVGKSVSGFLDLIDCFLFKNLLGSITPATHCMIFPASRCPRSGVYSDLGSVFSPLLLWAPSLAFATDSTSNVRIAPDRVFGWS